MPATETPEAPAISTELRGLIESLGYVPRVEVKSEPLTYERNNDCPNSYFRDLALKANGKQDAAERIARHQEEMRVERASFEKRSRRSIDSSGLEYRVNPNSTQGQGGYFDIPLWMNQYFATAPRTSRVLAALAPNFDLPVGAHSISLPRITTGNVNAPQQDGGATPGQDITDAGVTGTVTTFTSEADVALQLLEQSPAGAHLDWAFFKDMTDAYDQQLEVQMLVGTGSNANFTGLLNLNSINNVAYTTSSPTLYGMYPFLGQVAAQVGNKRKRPPEIWLMSTSRWAWIGSSLDNSNRPIVPPDLQPPADGVNDGHSADSVSAQLGWPVYVDDAIPVTLGAAANQDVIVACRPSDLILLEGTPRTNVYLEVLSGILQARIQMRNYAVFLSGRYPTSIGTLTGTGMVVQPGFS